MSIDFFRTFSGAVFALGSSGYEGYGRRCGFFPFVSVHPKCHYRSVSAFDGTGESLTDCAKHVEPWRQGAKSDPAKRAAARFPHTDTAARYVCVAAGGDVGMGREGAGEIPYLS